MKNTLAFLSILLCIFSIYSCSDDDNNKEHYLDNKLLEGKWHSMMYTDYDHLTIDSLIYTFKENKLYTEYYAKISGLDTLKYEGKIDEGNYLLTNTLILLIRNSPRHEYVYKLSNNNNTLEIKKTMDIPEYWRSFERVK